MDTKAPTLSAPQVDPPIPYQLNVQIEGCFVFALQTNPDNSDQITSVNIYGPASGHEYSAGIKGQWNNPYELQGDKKPKFFPLAMLEPRLYSLELFPLEERALSISELHAKISSQNLWPETSRPLGQGWDLSITLPPPDSVDHWVTAPTPVGDCFRGRASDLFSYMGLSQTLTYNNVQSFILHGSPLPVAIPKPVDGVVTFIISAEPLSIPTIEHQRKEVQALAQLMGLDLYLQDYLPNRPPTFEVDSSGIVCNSKTGSCMGGAIFTLS